MARFPESFSDPRGSAIQSSIQRPIRCRTPSTTTDRAYSSGNNAKRTMSRSPLRVLKRTMCPLLSRSPRTRTRYILDVEEGTHSCSISSEDQRQTTPALPRSLRAPPETVSSPLWATTGTTGLVRGRSTPSAALKRMRPPIQLPSWVLTCYHRRGAECTGT